MLRVNNMAWYATSARSGGFQEFHAMGAGHLCFAPITITMAGKTYS